MAVSYKPLMHTLIERKMSRQDLRKLGISPTIISKFSKDEYISLSVLDRICQILKCNIGDVVAIIPDGSYSPLDSESHE